MKNEIIFGTGSLTLKITNEVAIIDVNFENFDFFQVNRYRGDFTYFKCFSKLP